MAKEDRGFASMDRMKQREIASKGGKAAHQKGTAHEWTSEEAREAGRKGGMASHRRKQEQQPESQQAVASEMSSGAFGGSEDRRDAGLEHPRDMGERGPVRDEPNY
jgi:general stress protein YciG